MATAISLALCFCSILALTSSAAVETVPKDLIKTEVLIDSPLDTQDDISNTADLLRTVPNIEPVSADTRIAPRANLVVGGITVGDTFLYLNTINRNPINNAVQSEDILFTSNTYRTIRFVRALENGVSQGANAFIISGGVGFNYVTIRLQSAVSRGYSYTIDIWGR